MNEENKIEMMEKFKYVLENLSKNYSAFGSRIGFVVYNHNLKQVSGNGLSPDKHDKLMKVADFIYTYLDKKYSRLLLDPDIIAWLDTSRANPMSDLIMAIMSWAAAEERRKISERTKAGIQRLRNINAWKGGRPKKRGSPCPAV